MTGNKPVLWMVLEILKEFSDKNHLLTQNDILSLIYSQFDVRLQRKAIGKNIQLLTQLGYDIYHQPKKGYCLVSRILDESEMKYLIDAIFSSKNITGNQAQEMAKNLAKTFSKYQRTRYGYLYKSVDLNRNKDSDFFLNIEIINDAIEKKKQISFQYAAYDEKGNEVMRSGGYTYRVSPYYLVNNFGKYYLLCNYYKYDNITNFRVDLLRNIKILEDSRKPLESVGEEGKNFNIYDYINDHVYLFGGKVSHCKIKINHERVITYVRDWFGKNSSFSVEDGNIIADIRCDENAFYYWSLQYGEDIEVLEPKNIVIELSNHYKTMYERYRSVLENSEVRPNVEELLIQFLDHRIYKLDDTISCPQDILSGCQEFFKEMVTKNYLVEQKENNIIIRNQKDEKDKYLINFDAYLDDNMEENLFQSLIDIHKLEEISFQEYKKKIHITLVRNKVYYDHEDDSPIAHIFSYGKKIPADTPIALSDNSKSITMNHEHNISWKAITSTRSDRSIFKYFIL